MILLCCEYLHIVKMIVKLFLYLQFSSVFACLTECVETSGLLYNIFFPLSPPSHLLPSSSSLPSLPPPLMYCVPVVRRCHSLSHALLFNSSHFSLVALLSHRLSESLTSFNLSLSVTLRLCHYFSLCHSPSVSLHLSHSLCRSAATLALSLSVIE